MISMRTKMTNRVIGEGNMKKPFRKNPEEQYLLTDIRQPKANDPWI